VKVLALLAALLPVAAIADPLASSGFTGGEDPLSENGAWAPLTSLSPNGGRFQKNNAAFPNRFSPDHAGARTTAAIPDDHYSEIVVGHLASQPVNNNVGPTVRVQASGPTVDSHYLWWAGPTNGVNDLYRIDANGTSFTSTAILPTSAVADGDRLRLIARGPVIYGIKNGAREFIYNTGIDGTKLSGGTAGILAFVSGPALSDASIASWSAGAAPVSSGTWTSSDFAGVENPLDENDRWYPLPGYAGFRKAGGLASGLSTGHNASGVWSIAPPATQYSEVTLGTSVGGGGGPMVRIDRTNPGQTGWLLFLSADGTSGSGIYKVNPDGSFDLRRPFTPTIVPGDKWRLAADGNTLEVSQNGISQFTFTTDGSYPSGDVGIEALSSAFTFSAWEGGNPNGGPTIVSFSPSGGSPGTIVDITGTNFTSATAVAFNGTSATFTVTSDTVIQATVPAGATTGPLSVTTPSGTATTTGSFQIADPPTITGFAPGGGRPGAGVGIEGSGFTGATAVTFNGVSASFTVTTSIHIEATVPAGATTGPISVATPAGTATSTSVFTVGDPPTITSFAPASAPMGATVTISGTSFTSTSAVLFTQGVSASFTVISDTTIQATVPAGAMTGPLSVMTAVGGTSSSAPFTVQDAPAITGFTPASGPAGTGVTITGTSFTGATSVSFGAVSAAFTVVSDTQIQTAVPVGAKQGFVGLFVTTPGGKAQAADSFRVTGPPQIGSFTPSGPVGSSVTISGLDFTGATQVAFNGVSAGFAVVSDAEIQTTVPAGATSGPISVTTPLGTGTSRNSFFVTARLFVTKAGSGAGSVTSTSSPRNPNVTFSEINCGNVCSVPYAVGTVVTLNATAAAGSNFTGWIGCDSVSGTACTVTMNDARTITANFTQAFPLTVTKASTLGIGSGTVTSTSSPDAPGQIDCGSNCSVRFNSGTVVTLTATPDLLSVFNGWSGCDSASGPTCTVTMSAAKSVTANFLP
jgi:hypothetical protein